jgi:hypothetical protein
MVIDVLAGEQRGFAICRRHQRCEALPRTLGKACLERRQPLYGVSHLGSFAADSLAKCGRDAREGRVKLPRHSHRCDEFQNAPDNQRIEDGQRTFTCSLIPTPSVARAPQRDGILIIAQGQESARFRIEDAVS